MAALSYEKIKKQVQADREQKSTQVAQGASYEDIKKTVHGKRLLNSAQIYTLERDNRNLLTELQSVFNSWQDAQTIQKTIDSLPNMMKRMENYKNYLADYYTGQDQQEQLEQIEKQITDYRELSDLLQKQASFYSEYKNADEYENAKRIGGYYREYENSSYEEIQNSLSELKQQKGFYTVKGYDKEAQDIDKKIQWLENFYNNGYDKAPIEWRKEQYRQNKKTIAGLEAQIAQKENELMQLTGNTFTNEDVPAPSRGNIPDQEIFSKWNSELEELKAQRDALIAENNRYDRGQGQIDEIYDAISAIKKNDDYAALSQAGKSKIKGIFGDNTYDYINDIDGYRGKYSAQKMASGGGGGLLDIYRFMTNDEIGIYNYYYAKEGKDSAETFLEKLQGVLEQRQRVSSQEAIEGAISKEGLEGVAASTILNIASVPAKIIGGTVAFLDNSVRQISGQEINPDSSWQGLRNFANDVRGATSEQIEQNTGWEFLGQNVMAQVYNALMSTADSIVGGLTMGNLYTIAMGTGAAADKSAELYEKGASNGQIFWGGLSAGIAETVFEKVSLENLIKPKSPDSFLKVVLEVLKQVGIEGSEEIATEIANTITDSIIMGSQSDLSLAVKAYQDEGIPYEKAYKKALLDKVVDISWAGIAGFMSGGMSSSIITGYESKKNYNIGKAINKLEKGNVLVDFAMQNYGKNTEAYKMAERLSNNQNNSALALGSLYTVIRQQNQTDFAKASDVSAKEIQSMLENSGVETPQASSAARNIVRDIQGRNLSAKERQQLTNNQAVKTVYDSIHTEVENKKETVRTRERILDAIVNGHAGIEINAPDKAQNLDILEQTGYTNNRSNRGNAQIAGQTAASNFAGSPQTAPGMIGQENDRENGNAAGVNRGEGYAGTAEFRELQEASRGMPGEISALYHSGERTLDEGLRGDIARVLQTQINAVGNGTGNGDGILTLTAKGNTFHLHQQVNGALFHDVFEIAKGYLKNGELVDLHEIQTTEDGIGYEDCDNYLSDDGLSGFSITPEGDLISVFNASGRSGFLNAIAPLVKERAKTLDCYNSSVQPLMGIYSKVLGFKTVFVMDYNMEYDHDNIAANHDNPQVAFMVNTEQEVETRHFEKDQYAEAKAYRDGYVEPAAEEAAFFMPGESVITERSAQAPEADPVADTVYAVRGETRLTEDQRIIRRIGARLGWTVEFGEVRTATGMPADGKIDKANKVITISPENTRPIEYIFKHELTHFLEMNPVKYKTFADTVIESIVFEKWIHFKGYESIMEYNTAIAEEYIRAGEETFGEYEANLEIVADFVGENLFGNNQQVLEKLLSVMEPKQRRTFAEWIQDLFKRMKNAFSRYGDRGIRSEIEKLENLFMETYRDIDTKYNTEEKKRQQELLQDNIKFSLMNNEPFSENVNEVLNMSDAEAKHNAAQGNFIRVMKDTPEIILKNVEDAKNVEVIISFYSLYLAGREEGILEGHYHNLGREILYQIPEYIANPDAIVRMKNGRLNLLTQIKTTKGKNGIISVELNTVKDINNQYKNYNLIVSVFSAKDNYTENNIRKNGVKVEYKREDLSQVNSQLYKWLAIVNEKSSHNTITQNEEFVNNNSMQSIQKDTKKIQYSIPEKDRREIKNLIEKLNESDTIDIEEINENNAIKNSLKEMEQIPETYKINTPERKAKRMEIVKNLLGLGSYTGVDNEGKDLYNGNVERGYRIDFVVGLPAAGKSSVLVNPLSKQNQARIIDSDMAKEMIPEFNNGIGAGAVHEESKDIVNHIIAYAVDNGDNIVYPIVGGGNCSKLEEKIKRFKRNGYTVYLHLNELPLHKAMGRMLNRYLETGRFIPPQIVYEYQNTPVENFEAIIKTEGLVDGYSHYSNDVARGEAAVLKKQKNIQLLSGRGQRQRGRLGKDTEGIESEERNQKADLNKPAFSIPTDYTKKNEEVTEQSKNGEITEDQRIIRQIGARLGWTVEFGEVKTATGMPADGKIDKANKIITISPENTRPIEYIFKHELAHRGEGTKQYTELVKVISQTEQYEAWLQEKTGMASAVDRMEAVLNEEIRQRYDTAGESLSAAEVRAERMADFMGDMLFADESGMQRLLEELEPNARRSFLQWIKDALNYIKSKIGNADSWLKAELERLEQQYAQMLKESDAFNENKKNGFPSISNVPPKIQYFIGYTTENEPVVIIEENILEGVSKKDWVKTVKETIANKFSRGIPVSGRLIKVNQKTRNEYINSKYSQYLKNTKDKKIIFEDKLQSANNLDEIILASTNYINEDLRHERKDNFKEFARGDVFLRIGERDYSAKVIVGFTEGNQMVLYDVIDFESAHFQIKKAGASNSAYLRTVRNDAPAQHTVPQKGTDVNSIIFQNAENDTQETQDSISADYTKKNEEVTEQSKNGEITEDQRIIRQIGARLGWTVEFGEVKTATGMPADGKIDKANKIITISPENTRPIEYIFKHELAHRGEGTKQYTELVKVISQTEQYEAWLQEKTGMASAVDRMEAVLNEEIRQRYDTAGESLSAAEVRAERMADFMGDMLFADESGMQRLLEELEPNARRSFLQWIKDALTYIRSKIGNADSRLKAELELMESKYAQILRAVEMRQSEGKEQYSFAGIFAKNADNFKLDTAKKMEKSGEATPEEIRRKTGWYRGYDRLWRFEIDDSKMKIKETNIVGGDTKLGDVLEHPDLFAAYPQLKDITVRAQPAFLKSDADGWYVEETKEIVLNSKYLENAAVKNEIEVLKNTEAYQQYQEDLKKAAKKKDSKRVNLVLKFGRLQHTPAYQDYIKRRTEAQNANDAELCNQIEFEWQTSKTGREYQKLKNQFYELSNDTTLEEITEEFYTTEIGIRYLRLLRNIENADIVNNKETQKALMHEMQHAIQYIEGFANGSSPDFWKSHKNTMTEPEQKLYRKAGLEVKQLYEKLQEQFGWEAVDTTNESIMLENRLRTENLTKKELSRIVERIEEIHGIAQQKGYRTLQRETEKAAEELKAVEESIEARKKRTSEELYLSTAGEIEARDVVRRLELSAIERKQLRPDIDRTDVVFAEEDLGNKGIKVEGQGNLDTKETEGYNKNIRSDEVKEHLTESPSQLTETFYKELEKALSGENEENEITKDKYTLSNIEARKWYLEQEAKIPDLIDKNLSLEEQAKQAFNLRNQFRMEARELMADRVLAESLYKTDPNKSWEEMIQRQIDKGFTGDSIYKEIIASSQRSRKTVNKSLGLE